MLWLTHLTLVECPPLCANNSQLCPKEVQLYFKFIDNQDIRHQLILALNIFTPSMNVLLRIESGLVGPCLSQWWQQEPKESLGFCCHCWSGDQPWSAPSALDLHLRQIVFNINFLIFSTELSVKPSLNSTLIPPHVQRNSGGAGTSGSGTSTSTGPAVVDGAVASVSTPGSWMRTVNYNKYKLLSVGPALKLILVKRAQNCFL